MSIYDFEVKDYTGKVVKLEEYKGKVLLIVNTLDEEEITADEIGEDGEVTDMGFNPAVKIASRIFNSVNERLVLIALVFLVLAGCSLASELGLGCTLQSVRFSVEEHDGCLYASRRGVWCGWNAVIEEVCVLVRQWVCLAREQPAPRLE